jgi:large subunit ribosomal protein L21
MYAIVKVGGKQYRVEKGDSVVVDRMPDDEGTKVSLEPLLYRGDKKDEVAFTPDELPKVKVEAVVAGHERGRKVHVLKFKPKKGYKRRTGHRSELTRLDIKNIKLVSRRPAAKKEAAGAQAKETAGAQAKKETPGAQAKKETAGAAAKKGSGTAAKKGSGTAAKTKKQPAARKRTAKKEADDGS